MHCCVKPHAVLSTSPLFTLFHTRPTETHARDLRHHDDVVVCALHSPLSVVFACGVDGTRESERSLNGLRRGRGAILTSADSLPQTAPITNSIN